MSPRLRLFGLAAMVVLATAAEAAEWRLRPPEGGRGEALTFGEGEPVAYRFECAADAVVVTETGVTKLMDLNTGKPIGDDSSAAMPAGAAMMALFAGKGDPQFVPAEAVRNPNGGWDLTIRLGKDDRQLKAVGKSGTMSLFTTGYTMALAMDAADRAAWNGFLQRCKAAS